MSSTYNPKIYRLEQYIQQMSNKIILLSNELKNMNNKLNSLEKKVDSLSPNDDIHSVKKILNPQVLEEVRVKTNEFIIKNSNDENKQKKIIQLNQENIKKNTEPKLNKNWLTNFN